MNVLCIIPARGGSKRLSRKNARLVAGRPLVAHSIEHALASKLVGRTVVSTDDREIADIARTSGAEVVMRPAELSNDLATSEAALSHVLDHLHATEGYAPDIVVFLQCTSPVRDRDDIDRAIETLFRENADSLFSATESQWLLWRREGQDLRSLNYDYRHRTRDQDHPEEYRENGSIYVFKPWVLRQFGNRLGGKMVVCRMDYWSSFQVDSPADLALIDWVLRQRGPSAAPAPLPTPPDLVVLDFDGVMTDNRVLVFEDGREAVACNRGDGWGLQQLRKVGVPVLVLSTEANSVVAARCAKLKIPFLQGVPEKWPALQTYLRDHRLDPQRVIFIGNDVNDLECVANVGYGVAVQDAEERVRAAAKLVLERPGGAGAVRELCDRLVAALR